MSLHRTTKSRITLLTSSLWNRLVEPNETVEDSAARRQCRLLAGLLVVLIASAVISTVTLPLYYPGQNLLQLPEPYLYLAGLAAFASAYRLNRRGRYRRAALLTILATTAAIFATAIPEQDINELEFLYYLVAPILLANVMLSARVTIAVVALCIVGMNLLPVFVPQVNADGLPVFFVLLMSLFIGLASHHRDQLEAIRKAEILESEERYRTLAQNLPDITVLLFDQNLHYFMVEGAPLVSSYGYTNDTLRGMTLWDIMPAEAAQSLAAAYQGVFAGRESVQEVSFGERVYEEHFVPVKDAAGSIIAGMLLVRDITTTKQAESARVELAVERERVRVLRQFVDHAASHDLRTPLTVMKTSLYLLSRIDDPQKRENYLRNLNHQVLHLEKITENILAMSHLHKTDFAMSETPLDINQIVREVLMNEQLAAVQTTYTLNFVPDGRLPPVRGDSNALQQAVYHLLNNAVSFTPQGGIVTVRTLQREAAVVVEVEDNGSGINAEDLPNIFEPFFRADKARPLRMGEMGLGLAMVKQIVEAHGGHVEVESEVGKGSRFRLILAAAP